MSTCPWLARIVKEKWGDYFEIGCYPVSTDLNQQELIKVQYYNTPLQNQIFFIIFGSFNISYGNSKLIHLQLYTTNFG